MVGAPNHGRSTKEHDAGGKSVGLGIKLPFEQTNNEYVTPELDFVYHYFFTRKYWFMYQAKALVIFPVDSEQWMNYLKHLL